MAVPRQARRICTDSVVFYPQRTEARPNKESLRASLPYERKMTNPYFARLPSIPPAVGVVRELVQLVQLESQVGIRA